MSSHVQNPGKQRSREETDTYNRYVKDYKATPTQLGLVIRLKEDAYKAKLKHRTTLALMFEQDIRSRETRLAERVEEIKLDIETLEKYLGKEVEKNLMPMQPGDVEATFADVSALKKDVGYKSSVSLYDGFKRLVEWFKEYYA